MLPRVHSSNWFQKRTWVAVLAVTAILIGGCGGDKPAEAPGDAPDLTTADSMTIDRVLRTDDRFSLLVAAIDSTGLDSILASDGPYTLFAPPNSAFDRLPEGTMEVLLTERIDRLRTILAHHAVEGRVTTTDLVDASPLTMLSGDTLRGRRDTVLTVGAAPIVDSDVAVDNGLIHVVERVLRPPALDAE